MPVTVNVTNVSDQTRTYNGESLSPDEEKVFEFDSEQDVVEPPSVFIKVDVEDDADENLDEQKQEENENGGE